jgi:hypothetical protein
MKHGAEMGSATTIYTKFHTNWLMHSKVDVGDTKAHSHYGDRISLLLFFFFFFF